MAESLPSIFNITVKTATHGKVPLWAFSARRTSSSTVLFILNTFSNLFVLKVIVNYTSLDSFYYQQNSAFNIFRIISLNQIYFQSTLKSDFSRYALNKYPLEVILVDCMRKTVLIDIQ